MSDLTISSDQFTTRELALIRDYADVVAAHTGSSLVGRLYASLAMSTRDVILERENRRVQELAELSGHGFPDWDTCVVALPEEP